MTILSVSAALLLVVHYTQSESNLAELAAADTCLISKFWYIYIFAEQSSEIRRRLSSDLAVLAAGVQALTSGSVTPCSVDTGYSDQRLDTPTSSMAGSSASSQGGGGTPYSSRSGTPFSQDSGYTSGRLVVGVEAYREFHIKMFTIALLLSLSWSNFRPLSQSWDTQHLNQYINKP